MSLHQLKENPYTKDYDVLVFCNLYPPDGGGLERAAESLVTRLVQLKSKKVLVVFSADRNSFNNINGVDCLSYRTFKIFHGFYPIVGPKMSLDIFRLLRRNGNANIIIYGRHFTESMWASISARLLKRNYIYIDTGFEPDVFKNKVINKLINILDLTLFRQVVRFAKVRVFVSESSKNFVEKRYGRWIVDSEVILNGFEDSILEQNLDKVKQKKVVFASRLVNVKNPDTVVYAYLKLAPRYPDWKFYIIGKGECKMDHMPKDSYPENIIYINNLIPQVEFHKLLADSAIYINSSTSEGLPLSIVEAAALGCILVLSDIPHNMEVAKVAGLEQYSFPAKDLEILIKKLEKAMNESSEDLHKKIQSMVVKEFSNQQVFEKYWELIN